MLTLSLLLLVLLSPFQESYGQQDWPERAWTTLNSGLSDTNADKRSRAVHALALLQNDAKAESDAEKALTDTSPEVRAQAATALADMGAKSALPKLREAINDQDIKVAVAAANALYTFKDPLAYDVYYTLLTGERKGPGLVKSQMNTLKDKKEVEKLMFETGIGFIPFGGMGWQAYRTLTHDDSSPVRAMAAEKLATDPDPKTTEALTKACSDKQWRVRLAAVEAIAKRGDHSLATPVRALLFDDNDGVRFEAAAVVIRFSEKPNLHRASSRRNSE
jgi:HEAT repeat protein